MFRVKSRYALPCHRYPFDLTVDCLQAGWIGSKQIATAATGIYVSESIVSEVVRPGRFFPSKEP